MNKDILKGKWKETKGQIKKAWGKLTDDEVDQIAGDYDKLVGAVQKKYGYTKDEALKAVEKESSRWH